MRARTTWCWALWVTALSVFFLVSPPALAQANQVTLDMTVDQSETELDPGASETFTITLQNNGNSAGTVALTLSGGAAGWVTQLSADSVNVPAGSAQTVTLTVDAPASRDGATFDLALTVSGTITPTPVTAASQLPGGTASDSVQVAATLTPAPPPPPPPEEFPWLPVLGGTALLIALLVFGMVKRSTKQREEGIEIAAPAEQDARPGYDSFIPIEVRNVTKRPRVAKLLLEGVPAGWAAGASLTTVPLEPGQKVSTWIAVRPPVDAVPGSTTINIIVKPAEARGAGFKAHVTLRVAADLAVPERRGTDLTAPHYVRKDDRPFHPQR